MSRTYERIVNIFNCLDSYDKLMDFQAFPFMPFNITSQLINVALVSVVFFFGSP